MRGTHRDRFGRAVAASVVLAGCLIATGCTGAPDPTQASPTPANTSAPSASAPSASASTSSAPASPSPEAQSLVLDISIKGDRVDPSGQKVDAKVGQPVVLKVTSDIDDEIHAHTGGDGFELEVKAGQTSTGTLTLTSAGSFEVESHHLEKVIVILNAR